MSKDYYSILNIPNNSTKEEIVKAFRELAKKYHPDKNPSPNASDKFREVFEAYEILKDDEKRKVYDHYWNIKFKNKTVVSQNDFEPEFKEQRESAKQTADKYSKMPYEDFINSAIFEIKFVVKKTPTIGAIILLFCLGLFFLFFLIMLFSSNIEGGTGLFAGLFILLIAVGIFAVAISDWNKLMEEKKRQKENKNYR